MLQRIDPRFHGKTQITNEQAKINLRSGVPFCQREKNRTSDLSLVRALLTQKHSNATKLKVC